MTGGSSTPPVTSTPPAAAPAAAPTTPPPSGYSPSQYQALGSSISGAGANIASGLAASAPVVPYQSGMGEGFQPVSANLSFPSLNAVKLPQKRTIYG